jgi:hypothetical protein
MATKSNSLVDIFEKNRYNLDDVSRKSRAWFEQQVLLMTRKRITPNKVIQSNPQQLRAQVFPGFLYMFAYDPKLKETLPYYDMFPLVFPFRKVPGGFYGLNLHYLPYPLRVQLLDRLMTFANNDKMDETTKIKYSWQMIDGVSRYRLAQPCVKHYLNDHVRSPFRRVEANDWATAMMLPVERFQGATKEQVWTDSRRKAR